MFLVWLLAVPLAGAIVTLIAPNAAAKGIAAITSILGLIGYAGLLFIDRAGVNWSWIPAWGVRFHLVGDGLSLFLLGLAAVMFAAAIFASDQGAGRSYYFWMLLLEFSVVGLFSAVDLFVFYVFWEVLLIPVFFLLTGWSGEKGKKAAMKWLVMNLVGSFFMLVGIVALAVIHHQDGGAFTFEINKLSGMVLGPAVGSWLFFAFLVAFAIKAPLWPLHGWMPDAYGESPAPVTAVISGVLSKAGIYGMLRVMIPIFMPQFREYQMPLLIVAAIGLIYGAASALRQRDMKMVTAYGSLSHMSMMALGVFSLTAVGLLGTTFYMVAHGLMIGALFLVLGMLENRTGRRSLDDMAGLNHSAPRLAAYFLFFVLGALGLPGLPGFAGEYMIIQGLVTSHVVFAVIAGFVLVVAAWYMLRVFQAVMQGPAPTTGIKDLVAGQVAWLVPLAGLVILIGVWPAGITSHAVPSLYQAMHFAAAKGGVR
ncbi:MAG: NADH-quinone oxidoreductase subunit M [Sulfobacillus acidophilus]|uniref:NADH-quinone oxidoreductase subunit M n=1 Tax=Sulfobacillus acidophilus TaxID=53633 RepID=A0A2T2WML5_9FIRM|nr:MAG: NADH-quinone oxidoreductase subunit M [Sulfobacillus acidophilus]